MTTSIQTDRLVIRPVAEADRTALHELEQDSEVMRYLNGGRPTPLDPVAGSAFLQPRGDESGIWAVSTTSDRRFAGWVSLVVQGRRGCLGYRFHRACWGKGFATEAAAAVVGNGFERLGLTLVGAETMAVNLPSRRVLERLGMQHRRTYHGDWQDPLEGSEEGEVAYVLTRKRWHGASREGHPDFLSTLARR